MSEELRRGIPKAIPTGEITVFTEEQKRKKDEEIERLLKKFGVLKENETLKDMNRPGHIESD